MPSADAEGVLGLAKRVGSVRERRTPARFAVGGAGVGVEGVVGKDMAHMGESGMHADAGAIVVGEACRRKSRGVL